MDIQTNKQTEITTLYIYRLAWEPSFALNQCFIYERQDIQLRPVNQAKNMPVILRSSSVNRLRGSLIMIGHTNKEIYYYFIYIYIKTDINYSLYLGIAE